MADDANQEPGWYWIRSSDSDAEFPIRLREDGYWLLRGRPDSPCLPPSWSIVARIDDLLRDAARYRHVRDELSPEDFAVIPAEELDDFIDAEIAREKQP
jgi:hypothetical protein